MKSFLNYFADVNDVIGSIMKRIKEENVPAVLFGAGYCLPMFLELCDEYGIRILSIVDNDKQKWEKAIHDIPVCSLLDAMRNNGHFQILIATVHFQEIEKQLQEEGFLGQYYHLPVQAYHKNTVYGLDYIVKNSKRFSDIYHSFADDISKRVYLGILKHNISLDDNYYKEIRQYAIDGYFGTSLYHNRADEIIVDAGAFNGDTIAEFLSDKTRQFSKYYAFEPDDINYSELCQKISCEKFIPVCAGLGVQKETLKFRTGAGVSSRIDTEGESIIEIESIDHYFSEISPTFIKMDIEGAEEAALRGASRIIKNNLPTLAISAYHRKQDLYYLIELIQELSGKQYDIYLRHTFYYQTVPIQPDVIIYAIKKGDKL